MNQGTNLGSQIGRWIILAAVVALLGALLLTIRPVGAQSSAPIDVSYPENSTGRVGSPVYAQNPERRGVNWKVEGTDRDLFEINTNNNAGTLSFKDSPDFEDPKDGDENNLYVVIVRAVDPGGRVSAARTFNVAVTNVEEKGEVIVSHNGDEPWYGGLQPRVGVELLAYATDPDHIQDDVDTTADDVTWQWYRGDESSAVCGDSVSDNCLIEGADESAYTPSTGDVGKSLTVAALLLRQRKHHFAQGRGLRVHVRHPGRWRKQAPHLRTGRNRTDHRRHYLWRGHQHPDRPHAVERGRRWTLTKWSNWR